MIQSAHHFRALESNINYYIFFFLLILLFNIPAHAADKATVTLGYGPESEHLMDIYLPDNPVKAPVLVLVHGGGWKLGDKSSRAVIKNKVGHWLPKGFIVASINYRLLPEADPLIQAQDVALALSYLQNKIMNWGGDPEKITLIGHSAGGHLAALLSANPARYQKLKPWRASVILDSAAMDVPTIMMNDHPRLYDQAFGADKQVWTSASPLHQLNRQAVPMLLVCSTQRDEACPQAEAFVTAAKKVGAQTAIMREDLSHKEINVRLGVDKNYTQRIDTFIQQQLAR